MPRWVASAVLLAAMTGPGQGLCSERVGAHERATEAIAAYAQPGRRSVETAQLTGSRAPRAFAAGLLEDARARHLHYDAAAFALSVGLLLLYYAHLRRKEARDPTSTVRAVNVIARTAWVEDVMRQRKDLLAVQTLRNSTMAATFLASTAVLLIMGVLSLSGQADKLEGTWHSLNVTGADPAGLVTAKLLLLLADLVVAFFAFSMSIRVFNHVGYLINVPLSANRPGISPDHVATHLNRAGNLYGLGMRAYYVGVPLVFWLFGPHFMLLATVGMVGVLARIDRAPRGAPHAGRPSPDAGAPDVFPIEDARRSIASDPS